MVQRWHDLLFAHWRCAVTDVKPLIPPQLTVDTFDGSAWIGVIPFTMSGVRMRATLPVPTANAFPEINVRTYVTLDGRPGVWFFSLDCASTLAVIGARAGAHLPYFRATMRVAKHAATVEYHSERWDMAGGPAVFAATYEPTGDAFTPHPGTLDHFLTERYCLYSASGKRIWRGDIVHPNWDLQPATARIDRNSMIAAAGIRAPGHAPLLHFAAFQDVRFWWPARVR
jgi:uncharacterized protein